MTSSLVIITSAFSPQNYGLSKFQKIESGNGDNAITEDNAEDAAAQAEDDEAARADAAKVKREEINSIKSTLKPGDSVVVDGNTYLVDHFDEATGVYVFKDAEGNEPLDANGQPMRLTAEQLYDRHAVFAAPNEGTNAEEKQEEKQEEKKEEKPKEQPEGETPSAGGVLQEPAAEYGEKKEEKKEEKKSLRSRIRTRYCGKRAKRQRKREKRNARPLTMQSRRSRRNPASRRRFCGPRRNWKRRAGRSARHT